MDIEDKDIEEAEISAVEYAPKGMFPEDDDEDSFEIDVDEDLDVWNRGGGYTWGGGTSWWQRSYGGSSMTGMWSTNVYTQDNHAGRMLKNKGHIDSLCKVVDPTVPHTLEFATKHGSGHTDMRRGHIVVDGSLIRFNDNKLDTLAGLAIHEKLHVIHSMPLMTWQREVRPELCKTMGEQELFQSVSNIVEDEYIERQLHKTCAGYVHYIEACKEHYFAKSEIEVSEETSKFGDLINTFLMLVRYPSKIDLDRRKRHAPHIRILMSAIKSGIDSRDDTKTCIKLVYKYLIAQAEKMAQSGIYSGGLVGAGMGAIDVGAMGAISEMHLNARKLEIEENLAKGRMALQLKGAYLTDEQKTALLQWMMEEQDKRNVAAVQEDTMNMLEASGWTDEADQKWQELYDKPGYEKLAFIKSHFKKGSNGLMEYTGPPGEVQAGGGPPASYTGTAGDWKTLTYTQKYLWNEYDKGNMTWEELIKFL